MPRAGRRLQRVVRPRLGSLQDKRVRPFQSRFVLTYSTVSTPCSEKSMLTVNFPNASSHHRSVRTTHLPPAPGHLALGSMTTRVAPSHETRGVVVVAGSASTPHL